MRDSYKTVDKRRRNIINLALLIIALIFFAMNMGGSNIAPSFATLFGAKLIDHKKAVLWFTLFIFLGAVIAGRNVVKTLGTQIIPDVNFNIALIVLVSAVSGLFIANLLRVPESTSWTTVFALMGTGLALNNLKVSTLLMILPYWIVLPIIGFLLTYFIYKYIYPPRFENLWLYQKVFSNEKKVKMIAFISSCYIAFACGSNNVANAVGPLVGAKLVSPIVGLIFVAPLFGPGGMIFGKRIMTTVGEEIVPLGLISVSLIGFVTSSLLLFASIMGIPQSLVQMSTLCVMAVGAVKHERHIFSEKASHRIFLAWLITPTLSFVLGYMLVKLFL